MRVDRKIGYWNPAAPRAIADAIRVRGTHDQKQSLSSQESGRMFAHLRT